MTLILEIAAGIILAVLCLAFAAEILELLWGLIVIAMAVGAILLMCAAWFETTSWVERAILAAGVAGPLAYIWWRTRAARQAEDERIHAEHLVKARAVLADYEANLADWGVEAQANAGVWDLLSKLRKNAGYK
jgi:hypothetical protein